MGRFVRKFNKNLMSGCYADAMPKSWNKGFTKETHPSVAKISATMRARKIDNFKAWRDLHHPNSFQPFERSETLAFLIGITLGDGHVGKFLRTESLNITLGTDKPDLFQYTAKIVGIVFGKPPALLRRKRENAVDVRIYQKDISRRLGIPVGARDKLTIKLPRWIKEDKSFLLHCLKGLFEAEASLCIHHPTYTYNFSFANRNQSLLDEVKDALTGLGYHPERRRDAVRLRKKREALAFAELIKFRKYL